ncbi:helix-turn-helix transcriptional regulator [Halomonas koreensis]|uniref:AraC family transcriptional regulator n=1 Tax=Halomonas koreensis TaxID=245385 RepID=A0ABU1FZJ4_9GAMM|nr:AraC family transcriptional regulator [Halomonas koreensis]MDR5866076.1 AraC family transcriptional regulator [Halomonas koreensis]
MSRLPISVERSYPSDCLSDTHDHHQLLVGLDGRVDLEVEGRGAAVVPGGVCLIPAEARHHYLGVDAGNRCRVMDLAVGDARLDALFAAIRFVRLPPDMAREAGDAALLNALAGAPTLVGPRLNLARLTRRVLADPAGPWCPARLAEEACLSERQLRRRLTALTGLTPGQWLRRQRLALAARRLVETPAPVTDIALACGFADGPQFSRHFRDWRGVTPRAFRRRHR